MNPAISALHIRRLPGYGRYWQLLADLSYNDGEVQIMVPRGFVADGNSRPFKDADREIAGWFHDLLYRTDAADYVHPPRVVRRLWADKMYWKIIAWEKGWSWGGPLMDFLALRLIGWRSWHKKSVLFVPIFDSDFDLPR